MKNTGKEKLSKKQKPKARVDLLRESLIEKEQSSSKVLRAFKALMHQDKND